VKEERLDPATVLAECTSDDPMEIVRLGMAAAREERYERGLIFLAEAYRRLTKDRIPPVALSYYGLCLGMNKGRTKEAAEFCQLAIEKEFYNSELYLNLGRVWAGSKARKKAIEAFERGLAIDPRNTALHAARTRLGVRKRPVFPFLGRENPINVALGKVRHGLKNESAAAKAKKKKK